MRRKGDLLDGARDGQAARRGLLPGRRVHDHLLGAMEQRVPEGAAHTKRGEEDEVLHVSRPVSKRFKCHAGGHHARGGEEHARPGRREKRALKGAHVPKRERIVPWRSIVVLDTR